MGKWLNQQLKIVSQNRQAEVWPHGAFRRRDVKTQPTIHFQCKQAASRHGAEKMHEAVAKDAKLQIQVALGLVSQEQTPRKNISFDSWFPNCAGLNFQL